MKQQISNYDIYDILKFYIDTKRKSDIKLITKYIFIL